MQRADAFEMGFRAASSGLFFDTMELVAALSVSAGGFDKLEPFVKRLAADQRQIEDDLRWLTALREAAFGRAYAKPRNVAEYRDLLTNGVFEIVNHWSYIKDIKMVNRLQAWFYAGFGMGRLHTVVGGARYFADLRDRIGLLPPLDQMPLNLSRMAAEGSRQLTTSSEEDDFSSIRPLLTELASISDRWSLHLSRAPRDIEVNAAAEDDLRLLADTLDRCRRDFAAEATESS